jgi:hypothetical protein
MPAHPCHEAPLARVIVGAPEVCHARRRALDEVRDAETEPRQLAVAPPIEAVRKEFRLRHQAPEPIGRPREMVPDLGRPQAGVEADEEDAAAGSDVVRERSGHDDRGASQEERQLGRWRLDEARRGRGKSCRAPAREL